MSFVMNSPVKYVPLTLLLSSSASEADTGLRSLLENGIEISLSQPGSVSGSVYEVVYRGVTFRLTISQDVPELAGIKKIFCNLDASSIGCAIGLELSDHVAGGERIPAIIQALLGAGQKLGTSLGAVGAVWHPANIVSGFDYFSEAVADYLGGGAFPVLLMVNFRAGHDSMINSTGLSFVSGQELQIAGGGMEQNEIMRRVVRVAHDIAVNGSIQAGTKLSGIEVDEVLEFSLLPEPGRIRLDIRFNQEA
jgi:hypothetical protein